MPLRATVHRLNYLPLVLSVSCLPQMFDAIECLHFSRTTGPLYCDYPSIMMDA